MNKPAFFNEELCRAVIQKVMENIEDKLATGELGGKSLVVAIYDGTGDKLEMVALANFGETDDSDKLEGLQDNVLRKAELSQRTRMSLDVLHSQHAYLLREGDIVWLGAEYQFGMIFAASGVRGGQDQRITRGLKETFEFMVQENFNARQISEGQRFFQAA